MPVALVTGAGGFLGKYVCGELWKRNFHVIRLARQAPNNPSDDVVAMAGGVATADDISRIIDKTGPDIVFHLAGTSRSDDIAALYSANVFFAEAILQGALLSRCRPKILVIGSAAEYGIPISPEMVTRESDVCRPLGAYGISKLAQTHHALAAASKGLSIKVARLFNPIGVGSPETTALGSFVRQIAAMSGSGVLKTGPLDSVRDFIDVAEAARIIVDLSFTADDDDKVYNVCTGNGLSLSDLVGRLIAVSRVDVLHQVDSSRRGTSDLPVVIGSPERLRQSNIEVPRLAIDRLLEEMVEAERWRLRTLTT